MNMGRRGCGYVPKLIIHIECGQPKINDFPVAAMEHDILRFDVAVDDAFSVDALVDWKDSPHESRNQILFSGRVRGCPLVQGTFIERHDETYMGDVFVDPFAEPMYGRYIATRFGIQIVQHGGFVF
jgi:hypothetical protein